MGKASTGAKAGLLAGLVYSSISAALTYYSLVRFKEFIISTIEASLPPEVPISPEQAYELALMTAPIGVFIFGLVVAVIVGVIFGITYERLPGKKGVSKGLLIGVIFWVITLAINFQNLRMPAMGFSLVSGLITSLVYGALLGTLYDKFVTPRF